MCVAPSWCRFSEILISVLAYPEKTRLGLQFENIALQHDSKTGFRITPIGADGFLIRIQMIKAAERTLDLQYYIFRAYNTGQLLGDALLHAADRGVRVQIVDGETVPGDEQIIVLDAHYSVERRWSYRVYFSPICRVQSLLLLSSINW